MLALIEYKCPDCGRVFESGRGVGPHRRYAHGFKKGKATPSKHKRSNLKPTPIIQEGMEWDSVCERWATPCPQCKQPRRVIHMIEGTYLSCDNYECPLFKHPLDYARRVIAFPVTAETNEENENVDN